MYLIHDHSFTNEPFTQSVWSVHNIVIPSNTVEKIIKTFDSDAYLEDLTY